MTQRQRLESFEGCMHEEIHETPLALLVLVVGLMDDCVVVSPRVTTLSLVRAELHTFPPPPSHYLKCTPCTLSVGARRCNALVFLNGVHMLFLELSLDLARAHLFISLRTVIFFPPPFPPFGALLLPFWGCVGWGSQSRPGTMLSRGVERRIRMLAWLFALSFRSFSTDTQ